MASIEVVPALDAAARNAPFDTRAVMGMAVGSKRKPLSVCNFSVTGGAGHDARIHCEWSPTKARGVGVVVVSPAQGLHGLVVQHVSNL